MTGVSFAQVDTTTDESLASQTPVDVTNWLEVLPNLKQGIVYSISDSEIKYCSTTALLVTDYVNIELGAVPLDNEIILALTYEVVKLKDYVSIPLLDLIELNIGGYVGCKNFLDDNEYDAGLSATAINIKF